MRNGPRHELLEKLDAENFENKYTHEQKTLFASIKKGITALNSLPNDMQALYRDFAEEGKKLQLKFDKLMRGDEAITTEEPVVAPVNNEQAAIYQLYLLPQLSARNPNERENSSSAEADLDRQPNTSSSAAPSLPTSPEPIKKNKK